MANHISQFDMLQLLPDAFVWVKIRRVARQPFQVDRSGGLGQQRFDRFVMMDRCAIPNDQQSAAQLALQVLQEAHRIPAFECSRLHRHQQLACAGYPADHREMIARQRYPQNWRLSTRGVTAHPARQQVETGLVYPDDDSSFALALFLSAGQRSLYQAAITASSRWLARMIGFCGVQPRRARIRLTCAGW